MKKDIERAAERLLAFRPRSCWELENRLLQKGFAPGKVDRIIKKFKKLKLLDDLAFARAWIRNRNLLKPKSVRLLRLELRQKKIPEKIIEKALNSEAENDQKLAQKIALRKLKNLKHLPLEKRQRRLAGFLARRGFDWQIISQILKK